MEVRRIWNLSGPNVWARVPVLEVWFELGDLRGKPVDAAFVAALQQLLPGLTIPSDDDKSTLAHALQCVTLELQRRAGNPVEFGLTQEVRNEPGVYQVVVAYQEVPVAEACLATARRLLEAVVRGEPFPIAAELERLTDIADRNRYGRATAAMEAAARRRNIPVEHINPDDGRLMALGWGVKQRWILAAQTERTSDIGQAVSQDKELTKSLLRLIGVPVPEGHVVTTPEGAWAAAQELAGPVVTKPRDRDLSVGVRVNLRTREQVIAGFELARSKAEEVIVEQYAVGFNHRLLVVGGCVVAATREDPPRVTGDGRSTIAELVEQVNAQPDRGDGYSTPRAKIKLDEWALEALTVQGYTLESVPPAGTMVRLRYGTLQFESGGTITDVTEQVHPEVAARVIEAVRMLRIDVAGVDVVAHDISRPLEEQGGMLLEVNVGPGLWLHMAPWCDHPRPVAEAIIGSLIPEGDDGRIPIVAITGVNGKTTTAWLLTNILRACGKTVGLACTDGLFIQGRQISRHDCSGPRSARAVLNNPTIEVGVLETARGGILRQGLGFDFCDVALVTNIGEGDHLGLRGVETREDLARVKTTIVKAVAPRGVAVLNAADPLVAAMAPHCQGRVLFFARDESQPVLAEHVAAGGLAATVRDDAIALIDGPRCETLLPLSEVPMTLGGRVNLQVDNVLAAAAVAWVLGMPLDGVRASLRSFVTSPVEAPGRFNVFRTKDATIIVDYAHNGSALAALAGSLNDLPHKRRLIVYCGADRRDDDVIRQGQVLGSNFDHILLCRDRDHRDRYDGELSDLLQRGIGQGGRVQEVVEYPDEQAAINAGLDRLKRGDLLVIGPESVEEAIALVQKRLGVTAAPGAS